MNILALVQHNLTAPGFGNIFTPMTVCWAEQAAKAIIKLHYNGVLTCIIEKLCQ